MGKIIVIGDSIVYGKWDSEGGWVARLRKWVDQKYNIGIGGNFQVYQLGIPGEVAIRLVKRFESEIAMRLTSDDERYAVLIAVGINDTCPNNWMTNMQTPEEDFKSAIGSMIDIARKYHCKVGVIGLTPIDASKTKKLLFTNAEVMKYDQYITQVCKEREIPKLDIFTQLQNNQYMNHLADQVHPNNEGHEMLFQTILTFLKENEFFDYLV